MFHVRDVVKIFTMDKLRRIATASFNHCIMPPIILCVDVRLSRQNDLVNPAFGRKLMVVVGFQRQLPDTSVE